MAISRYDVRLIVTNEDQGYQEDILDRRGIKKINHFSTPKLRYPTPEEINDPNSRPFGREMITWRFRINNARDVAWASSSAFVVDAARINLPSGKNSLAISA